MSMTIPVTIIDYGMGNLGSLRRSLEECGGNPHISNNPDDLHLAERIVLPGVGAYPDGMTHLREVGWIPAIQDAVIKRKIPLLGICLGMQLLASKGFEAGGALGLDLIPGEVPRLIPQNPDARIPHIGWNEVLIQKPDPLFEGIPHATDFYFVHSYHFVPFDTS